MPRTGPEKKNVGMHCKPQGELAGTHRFVPVAVQLEKYPEVHRISFNSSTGIRL